MSETNRRVFLFPGQGAYLPGAMAAFAQHDRVRGVLDEIDRAVPRDAGGVSDLLLRSPGRPLPELLAQDPLGLQLALLGTSVALFGEIADLVEPSDVLVGHSLGEIGALTAAGAWTVGDAARIVAARTDRLAAAAGPDGGMLALSTHAEVAAALVAAADDASVVVAVRNSPRQTVLSGPRAALARIAAAAAALGIATTALASPFAFHHPALAGAAASFRSAIAGLPVRPLRYRVHSPILGRAYRDEDDLAELLARHLVRPVDLLTGIRGLHERGHTVYVECGARDALVAAVRRTVPGVQTLTCLDGSRPGPELIADVRDRLTGPVVPVPVVSLPVGSLVPVPVVSVPVVSVPPCPGLAGSPLVPVVPAPVVPAPVVPAPVLAADPIGAPAPGRAEVIARLRAAYAAALDYPESVFTDEADLEADLGVDSVKQTELLARMSDEFGVLVALADIGLAELATLGRIADAIVARQVAGPGSPVASPAPAPTAVPAPTADRAALLSDLRRTYAGALDYPESVFTETADLEADLGIDSVKQTELLARVSERLPGAPLGRDVPLAELTTLGAIVDFMLRGAAAERG
ncbi:acyltransferase domain-containing protein [Nakamurella multipartita]|uniref:[acyl-carrier-protein] S-malonyltransferase n=1 Tax=Nakamurella multipartita (strain ATCC 700099 / DSM 44233 / CIP 104796 / JCM 9543 / NBRC 105858 / Y-104) TaxID=479431 RepID=C8XGU9_NAKMY|nr:acyltransferase domain-containing protein [Nakamurella multipartita]ACV80180.1 Acyl transferase [Nakamurella multipartita DSM 44233]